MQFRFAYPFDTNSVTLDDFDSEDHASFEVNRARLKIGGHYGGWYDPYWGPYGGSTHVSNYEEGTLVIDIVQWEKKEMAWRGLGTSILEDIDDPEKVTEYVNIWVAKILAEFPPKK